MGRHPVQPKGTSGECSAKTSQVIAMSSSSGPKLATSCGRDHTANGVRKNLLASLDQSLSRLGLEYVDIFYSHRRDPNTPLEETMSALDEEGIGCIVFSPLAQGQLTSRYLKEIPADSRAAKDGFLKADQVRNNLPKVQALNEIAQRRGQSVAQIAIAWVLRLPVATSALLGASSVAQLEENLKALEGLGFSSDELSEIEYILPT